MKRLILLFLIITLALNLSAVETVDTIEVKGIYYELHHEKMTASVIQTKVGKYIGDIIIPSSINYNEKDYLITVIEFFAFEGSDITSLTIGENVSTIYQDILYGCEKLATIIVDPKNMTYDSRNNCNAVIETVSNELILGCKNSLIPNTVVSIGFRAFSNCTGLTSINIPENVKSIKDDAFADCSNLKEIKIPDNVLSIGDNAFTGCFNLPVENGLRYADTYLVEAEDNTRSDYIIKEGTRFIGNEAFNNCTNLSLIKLPQSLFDIGNHAFWCCSSLQKIDIPDNVVRIGMNAFYNCTNLVSVSIPSSMKKIEMRAFSGCSSLSVINIPSTLNNIETEVFEGCSSLPVEDNLRYADTYLVGAVDKTLSEYRIKDGTRFIGNMAFRMCEKMTSLKMPQSLTYIEANAFNRCNSLVDFKIPSTVTQIKHDAFFSCKGLKFVHIPNSVTSIGVYAFGYCENLKVVNIPNSVKSIGQSAFEQCNNLISVDIPEDLDTVYFYLFRACNNLTSVTIPSGVKKIWFRAFEDTYNIQTITCLATTVPDADGYVYKGFDPKDVTLFVPDESINAYKATTPWNEFGSILPLSQKAIETVPVVITDAGVATFCSNYDLNFKDANEIDGIKAFAITGYNVSKGTLSAKRIYDVPAGTGIYLEGIPGTYNVPINNCAETSVNLLRGTTEPIYIVPTDGINYNYVLCGTNRENACFMMTSAGTLPANKAYLQLPIDLINNTNVLKIQNEEETSLIDNREEESNFDGWYTLEGYKLDKRPTQKGLYIQKGKKIIIM